MAKNYKILIAEDEKPMATALEMKLNKAGFEAKAVFEGQVAINILSKEKYNLLLLDLMMPKADGFEVMQKIKELNIKTPIIVLSNLGQEEDKKKALEAGAKDYFVKSDTPIAEIVKKVSIFLNP